MLAQHRGFVYYVSIAGITGTRSAGDADVARAVARLKRHTDLPVAVGFGIRTPEQAAAVARVADAAVVGSALVDAHRRISDRSRRRRQRRLVAAVLGLVRQLAAGVRGARQRRMLDAMNWLTNFVRPKLQALVAQAEVRRTISGTSARACGQMIFHRDLEANLRVCTALRPPHARRPAKRRLELLFDDGQYRAHRAAARAPPIR